MIHLKLTSLFEAAAQTTAAGGAEGSSISWQDIAASPFFSAAVILLVMFILWNLINHFLKRYREKGSGSLLPSFIGGILKALILISGGIRIFNVFGLFTGLGSQIFMSSSLIVAVLGFIFQEGISNIIHGFLISLFHPFNIGDRVRITVDGLSITGYIDAISLRHTVIINILDSSRVIVPNSKMDTCVIENTYVDSGAYNSAFLDISITYESDLEKAIELLRQTVQEHPAVVRERERQGITDPVPVLVWELEDSGILLRAKVITKTVEENFVVCSDIRRTLIRRFKEDPDLDMAYPHMHIVGLEGNAAPQEHIVGPEGNAAPQEQEADGEVK